MSGALIRRFELDGGFDETTSVDICPGYFEDKLLGWLKEQGVEPRVEPWHI